MVYPGVGLKLIVLLGTSVVALVVEQASDNALRVSPHSTANASLGILLKHAWPAHITDQAWTGERVRGISTLETFADEGQRRANAGCTRPRGLFHGGVSKSQAIRRSLG